MYGESVKRYCDSCKKEIVINGISYELRVKDKVYYDSLCCPFCQKDLSEKDRELLRKAKENDENIIVVMC